MKQFITRVLFWILKVIGAIALLVFAVIVLTIVAIWNLIREVFNE